MNFPCASSPFTWTVDWERLRDAWPTRLTEPALYDVSVRRKRRFGEDAADDEMENVGLTNASAGFLPTAGHPNRSCPHLVLCQSEWTFGILYSLKLPVSHRGLAPHKFTPMPGVPRSLKPPNYWPDLSHSTENGNAVSGSVGFGLVRSRLNSAFCHQINE